MHHCEMMSMVMVMVDDGPTVVWDGTCSRLFLCIFVSVCERVTVCELNWIESIFYAHSERHVWSCALLFGPQYLFVFSNIYPIVFFLLFLFQVFHLCHFDCTYKTQQSNNTNII